MRYRNRYCDWLMGYSSLFLLELHWQPQFQDDLLSLVSWQGGELALWQLVEWLQVVGVTYLLVHRVQLNVLHLQTIVHNFNRTYKETI